VSKPPTVLLLLPAAGTLSARASDAVRQGFFAARKVSGLEWTVQVVELGDRPGEVKAALQRAQERGVAAVVGPLLRTQVNEAVAVRPSLPVVTLTLPDSDPSTVPSLLPFGLSVEQEARVIAQAALRYARPLPPSVAGAPQAPRFAVLSGEAPLSRRAAAAFGDVLKQAGEAAVLLPVGLKYDQLNALSERIAALRPEAVFMALEAREAAIVRPRLPADLLLFSTSQINVGGAEGELLGPEMEGIHFVDAPWLLEPEHQAVMIYPKPDQSLSAELSRLYALGIDAFRLTAIWMQGRSGFTLDGVTGALSLDPRRSLSVERWPSFAVFRGGKIQRIEVPR
jgi:hypothetical protein